MKSILRELITDSLDSFEFASSFDVIHSEHDEDDNNGDQQDQEDGHLDRNQHQQPKNDEKILKREYNIQFSFIIEDLLALSQKNNKLKLS